MWHIPRSARESGPLLDRREDAGNQLHGWWNSIVCLTNIILHMRRYHSAVAPVSQINSIAAERPPEPAAVRGQTPSGADSNTSALTFLLQMPTYILTSFWQPECGFLFVTFVLFMAITEVDVLPG